MDLFIISVILAVNGVKIITVQSGAKKGDLMWNEKSIRRQSPSPDLVVLKKFLIFLVTILHIISFKN